MNRTWLIIGGGTSAAIAFDLAMADHPDATTITCNAGGGLFLDRGIVPDYFLMYCTAQAFNLWSDDLIELHRRGCHVIGERRSEGAVFKRLGRYSERIEIMDLGRALRCPPFDPAKMVYVRFSGLMCLQYALHHGAETVVLVGMEGYRSTRERHVVENFDGRMGRDTGQKLTNSWIRVFTNSCIERCPQVRFIFYGRPNYEVERRANVQIVEMGEPCQMS